MPGRKHLKQSSHNLTDSQRERTSVRLCHYLYNRCYFKPRGSAGSRKSRNLSDGEDVIEASLWRSHPGWSEVLGWLPEVHSSQRNLLTTTTGWHLLRCWTEQVREVLEEPPRHIFRCSGRHWGGKEKSLSMQEMLSRCSRPGMCPALLWMVIST